MQSKLTRWSMPALVVLLLTLAACGAPSTVVATPTFTTLIVVYDTAVPVTRPATATAAPPTAVPATETASLLHGKSPASPRGGKVVYDVESASSAAEKRAHHGDSYDINRLERPFREDMTYIPELDIQSFTVNKDDDWWYVTIELLGIDPDNALDIHYGVELDLDHDGFGDFLIWAHPPYTDQWATMPIQIYQDTNHDTAGLSEKKSDAPLSSDGYESLIFDGSRGGSDPDLAWVRVSDEKKPIVQFAFKKTWSGIVFMLGVIADAGLKDPGKLDYVDRFPIAEAGSPMQENPNYPLQELFLIDNTCRQAFGFEPTRFEPQLCPVIK